MTSLCLALIIAGAAGDASAQQTAPQVPTFTSRTELVTVPVVVMRHQSVLRQLGKSGWLDEHVTGLTKDAFTIEEDGQPQAIASFEEVRGAKPAGTPIPRVPGVYTNEISSADPVSMVVIVLDLINTPYQYQANAKAKLLQYLKQDFTAERPTMLAVLHPNGLRILHEFTTDPKILATIVRRIGNNVEHDPALDNQVNTEMSGMLYEPIDLQAEYAAVEREFVGNDSGYAGYQEQLKTDRLQVTFFEMQQLAHALSAVRGMKSLVWATGGLLLPSTLQSRTGKTLDEYDRTLRLLSATGVSVYPIDVTAEAANLSFSSPQSRYPGKGTFKLPLITGPQMLQNFMDIAERTGGDYCLMRKDPDHCFQKAVDYNAQYYLLSYYAHSGERTRWRKIKVKVHGEDVKVMARNGYFPAGTTVDAEASRKTDIAQAFATPLEYRGLPIQVKWTEVSGGAQVNAAASGTAVHPKRSFALGVSPGALTVDAANNNHISLDVVAVALDSKGNVLADSTQRLDLHPNPQELERLRAGGFRYTNAVEVPAHTSRVKFIVRDDLSARIGTVSIVEPAR